MTMRRVDCAQTAGLSAGMTPMSVLAGVRVGLDQPVRLMAALNVSPESFYAGSVHGDAGALRAAAQQAVAEGADIIDIGARSTAPYRDTVIPLAEEVRRMTWAVEALAAVVGAPLSADTTSATVAAAALAAGARIINDVSGLRADGAMADIAAQGEGVVLMASPGAQSAGEPVPQVRDLLRDSLARAQRAGIERREIVLDPGIGFFTRSGLSAAAFNCAVLAQLRDLAALGCPLVVGVSRKAFLGHLTGRSEPAERLAGSLAATSVAVYNGASMIRTHDVAATRDAVRVAEALRRATRDDE
jgi:dihydropteroate synthase